MLGSRSTLFALGRVFVDRRFASAMRSIVSDLDAPVRLAAIDALSASASETAVPYLVTGVMDRDKRVRDAARSTLRDLIGEEAYHEQLDALQAEVGWFRKHLQGLGQWGRDALSSLEASMSDVVGGARTTPTRVRDAARRLFRKQEG